MANQYTSDKKTTGELLSMTSPHISVPDYQRSFSWDTTEVETFWQDLLSFSDQYPDDNIRDEEYFLGSIVLVNEGETNSLLDGQQRLATTTILLSVIRDFLMQFSRDAATRTSQKYITDFDDAKGTYAFKLTLNEYDRDFFRREVQEVSPSDGQGPTPTMASHTLIRRARHFFQREFVERYDALGGGEEAFKWALRVRSVLTDHVSVVAVASSDEDNAANVFETLNDRGIGLSTPDLLRNFILRRASPEERDEIVDCWKDVLQIEEDAAVDEFLRHYWLSHYGDVKTRALYKEIKRAIQSENRGSLPFSRDLQTAAHVYRDIVTGREENADLRRLLEDVNTLGAKALYPAILSAYAVGDDNQRLSLLRSLIALYVRHSVISGLESSRLETIVFSLAKDLRSDSDFPSALRRLREAAPPDDEFVERFKVAKIGRRASARYILTKLELDMRRTEEIAVEAPDRVHIEHIYPLNPPAEERWDNHESAVERLGNLTLLDKRLNTTIRNSNFEIKQPYYEKSELLLSQRVAEFVIWSMDEINERQSDLSDRALAIWSFPEP